MLDTAVEDRLEGVGRAREQQLVPEEHRLQLNQGSYTEIWNCPTSPSPGTVNRASDSSGLSSNAASCIGCFPVGASRQMDIVQWYVRREDAKIKQKLPLFRQQKQRVHNMETQNLQR